MATYNSNSYNTSNYASFRPTYPEDFFEYLAKWAPDTDLAVDVGCGPGTATSYIAKHVGRRTVGIDPSETMIETAKKQYPDLDFKVSSDTDLTKLFEPNSVDLITVAEAAHWFSYPDFLEQVEVVLKPGGRLAIWGYIDPATPEYPALRDNLRWMSYSSDAFGPYWDPGRQLLTDAYKDIEFPASLKVEKRDIVLGSAPDYNEHALNIVKDVSGGQFFSFLRTYSSYFNWRKANPGKKDLVDDYIEKLAAVGVTEETPLHLQWDTVLILVQKK